MGVNQSPQLHASLTELADVILTFLVGGSWRRTMREIGNYPVRDSGDFYI
jgi:hypothetical protein